MSPGRPKVLNFIRTWPRLPNGKLDLNRAPFILNAIINRLDLSHSKIDGQRGQLRFVFQALEPSGKTTRMMINFEFSVPFSQGSGNGKFEWAKAWHRLGTIPFGSAFNEQLAQLTTQVFKLSSMNELALFRLRTGDGIFSAPPEMRSFCVNPQRTSLHPCLTDFTPSLDYAVSPTQKKNPERLVEWIKKNAISILKDEYTIPLVFKTTHNPIGNFKWAHELENSPDLNLRMARRRFAINTCNGCHNIQETDSVVMIGDRSDINKESTLSPFVKQDLVIRRKFMEKLIRRN